MQRPGSRQMRRPASAAAAVLLLAAAVTAACLPGALGAQFPVRLPGALWAEARSLGSWPPVYDAPEDGCIYIGHRVLRLNGTDYAGVCQEWGQEFVETQRIKNQMEVVCSRCGLKEHTLLWAPHDRTSCPPDWLQLANATFETMPDGTNKSRGFLCAAHRPACLTCEYTWRGADPVCNNAHCLAGETLLARHAYGDGSKCSFGAAKDLCERCYFTDPQSGGASYDLKSPLCNNTCASECNNLGETLLPGADGNGQCPRNTRCMKCPLKPTDQLCTGSGGSLLGGGGASNKAKCGGRATGIRWTDKPSITATAVKSGASCCTACLRNARCQRYQFSSAARVGCQLFYSKAPTSTRLTKKERGFVRGQKIKP